jgi:hypothetical protein
MGLTEHTGHGISTIINKYACDVFEIENNYIRCAIPFGTAEAIAQKSKVIKIIIEKFFRFLQDTKKH